MIGVFFLIIGCALVTVYGQDFTQSPQNTYNCLSGSVRVNTLEACKQAGLHLNLQSLGRTWHARSKPPGCFYSQHYNEVFFNQESRGASDSDSSPICMHKYTESRIGSDKCITGSIRINSADACKEAGSSMEYTSMGRTWNGSSKPSGCFYSKHYNEVFFNQELEGGADADSSLICGVQGLDVSMYVFKEEVTKFMVWYSNKYPKATNQAFTGHLYKYLNTKYTSSKYFFEVTAYITGTVANAWYGYNTIQVDQGGRSVIVTYIRNVLPTSKYARKQTTRKEVLNMIKSLCPKDVNTLNTGIFKYISAVDIGIASFMTTTSHADVWTYGDHLPRTWDTFVCGGEKRALLMVFGSNVSKVVEEGVNIL